MKQSLSSEQDGALEVLADRANVVVGIDGSPVGQRALQYAAGVARRLNARLVVVHVRRVHLTYDGFGPRGLVEESRLRDDVWDEADRVAGHCEVSTAFLDLRSRSGVAPTLADVASRIHAHVVVVGANRRRSVPWRRSTGAHLLESCRCPVTVVP